MLRINVNGSDIERFQLPKLNEKKYHMVADRCNGGNIRSIAIFSNYVP